MIEQPGYMAVFWGVTFPRTPQIIDNVLDKYYRPSPSCLKYNRVRCEFFFVAHFYPSDFLFYDDLVE